MNKKRNLDTGSLSAIDFLDREYLNSKNKDDLDYWDPLSNIVIECLELRGENGLSQNRLSEIMKTRQSVISRFENMGRIPSYDFIARLAKALGHTPGVTLHGDYMATVPLEQQTFIKHLAEKENIPTKRKTQDLLEQAISIQKLVSDFCSESLSDASSVEKEKKRENHIIDENMKYEKYGYTNCQSVNYYSYPEEDLDKAS